MEKIIGNYSTFLFKGNSFCYLLCLVMTVMTSMNFLDNYVFIFLYLVFMGFFPHYSTNFSKFFQNHVRNFGIKWY